jgi:ribulose 1,5-bisphosphate synthetase/thiazole synthase
LFLIKSKGDLAKSFFVYCSLLQSVEYRNRSITNTDKETKVAIIGAGVSGLTLAAFLQKSGVACVVLESRQWAGVVEGRGGRCSSDGMQTNFSAAVLLKQAPII